jgi:pilus assembly protein CpaE
VSRMNHRPPRPMRIVSVCLDPGSLATLQHYLGTREGSEFVANFRQYFTSKDDVTLIQRLADALPDIVMVDFDQDRESAAVTAEHLQTVLQGRACIFAVSAKSDSDLIISAMRSGCSEYLVKPVNLDRVAEAFAKVESKRYDRQKSGDTGKIITLLGAKGGAGVTTIATHVATFLARLTQQKVLLIDQHSDLGDVALYLGIDKHLYNFYELVNNVQRLDSKLVQGFVVHHSSGLDVLAAPDAFDTAFDVPGPDVEFTLDFLKTTYDYTFIDCAPGLSGLTLAAVQKSDEVWLVGTQDVPSVRNLSRYLHHLTRFSFPVDAVRVVINRYSRKSAISREHIEKVLKRPVHMMVPNSYAEVMESVNTGNPVLPEAKSEFSNVIKRWAESLAANETGAVAAKEEPKRMWGILRL